jgi:hypothetical protein
MVNKCEVPTQEVMDDKSTLIVLGADECVPVARCPPLSIMCVTVSPAHVTPPRALRSCRSVKNLQKLMETFVGRGPKFFTFNDGWARGQRPRSIEFAFETFLTSLFPEPSQYELKGAPW